ncbi:MAG: glycosyltransferase family 2 protein [Dehalococcoidia bacterium]
MGTSVDIVVPTFNRHARLASTLRGIAAQTVRNYRTIVVDDGSSPRVSASLDPALAREANVTCLATEGNGGPARARNLGVAAGDAPLIAFVDDDVDPVPDWLQRHLAAHEGTEPVATIGPLLAPPGWRPTPWNWWEAQTLAREYARMQRGLYAPTCRQFFTGNAMVRRQDFEAVGGFNEALLRAEDIELGLRLHERGVHFSLVTSAVGWHDSFRTADGWRRMARQYALADRVIDELHPDAGWAAMVARERAARRRGVLVARRIDRSGLAHERLVGGLLLAARVAFASGVRRASSRALALAFDLEYSHAERESAQSAVGPVTALASKAAA